MDFFFSSKAYKKSTDCRNLKTTYHISTAANHSRDVISLFIQHSFKFPITSNIDLFHFFCVTLISGQHINVCILLQNILRIPKLALINILIGNQLILHKILV